MTTRQFTFRRKQNFRIKNPQIFEKAGNSIRYAARKMKLTHESLITQTKEIPENIKDTVFATQLRRCNFCDEYMILFVFMAHLFVENNDDKIARKTGRSIMRVDVDKIKSCWVGESEKNIKVFFDRYRRICKNSKLAPILLFNEADAILGVRMEGASHAVDKMENSIQNIILQEMESLDGIMIATTNLTTDLDKAFERRFLYKIRFDKPTVESRAVIWQTMIKGLTGKDAGIIASQFDLSGGEIENVASKHSVNLILSGKEGIDLDELITACRLERLNNTSRIRIGF